MVREKQRAYNQYSFMLMQVSVGNNGYTDGLWKKLALGSVVLHVENTFGEWYYPLLVRIEALSFVMILCVPY